MATRLYSCQRLNQVLADTQILYALYKKHHWLMRGATFYQLHLLLDKHAGEQLELVDMVAERVQTLGGVAVGDPGTSPRSPSSRGRRTERKRFRRCCRGYSKRTRPSSSMPQTARVFAATCCASGESLIVLAPPAGHWRFHTRKLAKRYTDLRKRMSPTSGTALTEGAKHRRREQHRPGARGDRG